MSNADWLFGGRDPPNAPSTHPSLTAVEAGRQEGAIASYLITQSCYRHRCGPRVLFSNLFLLCFALFRHICPTSVIPTHHPSLSTNRHEPCVDFSVSVEASDCSFSSHDLSIFHLEGATYLNSALLLIARASSVLHRRNAYPSS
jgi:hypothetical protein